MFMPCPSSPSRASWTISDGPGPFLGLPGRVLAASSVLGSVLTPAAGEPPAWARGHRAAEPTLWQRERPFPKTKLNAALA